MNLEIKEKYNNFVKIIETKEKLEWLKQTNNGLSNLQDGKEFGEYIIKPDDCSCNISSGYGSISNEISNKISTESKSKSKSNKSIINDKIQKHVSSKKYSNDDELSLLEDDYFISRKNLSNSNDSNPNDNSNISNKSNNSKSVKTEFQNIFTISKHTLNKKIIKKNESSEIKNKLENIYNKIVVKNSQPNDKQFNKLTGYNIANYINPLEQINKKNIDTCIKNLSHTVEYIFNESIRGWNQEHNLYVVQFEKLKENFEKIIFNPDMSNDIKLGVIYRDFDEPKTYLSKNFTKYWVGYDIKSSSSGKLQQIKYSIKDKILFYCLKNLSKSNKFKKKISNWNYKFIKKTVQVYSHKNLLIDMILIIGIKSNE